MIISDRHRFVFVEVPKAASTSVKTVLMKYNDRPRVARHATLSMILDAYPDVQSYFKFGVDRDIKTWRFSTYRHARRKQDHPVAHRDMTWDEYVKSDYVPNWYHRDGIVKYLPDWHDCKPWNWLQGVDAYMRFECLDKDWEWVCKWGGIPHEPLPHMNKHKWKEKWGEEQWPW